MRKDQEEKNGKDEERTKEKDDGSAVEKRREEDSGLPEEYELNLSNFALFLSVMSVKEAYEIVLQIIMEDDFLELTEVRVEQIVLNKSGKRAIRLDAWAVDKNSRQFNTEMQNDTSGDDVRKRSRFYQGLIDSPILKSGKKTKYKHLPSTVIIFITQEDIFHKDLAMYTFTEQCEEVEGLHLDDGTKKIFLNMSSKNGRMELISLLQYMKDTRLDNPEIPLRNKRLERLDRIVGEVKESQEWETVKMDILDYGIQKGMEQGLERGIKRGKKQGEALKLVKNVEAAMRNFNISLAQACKGLDTTVKEYNKALRLIKK